MVNRSHLPRMETTPKEPNREPLERALDGRTEREKQKVWEILSRTGIPPDDPTILLVVEFGLLQAIVSDLPQRLDAREITLSNLIATIDTQTTQIQTAADAVAHNIKALNGRIDRLMQPQRTQSISKRVSSQLLGWTIAFGVGVILSPIVSELTTQTAVRLFCSFTDGVCIEKENVQ